jgi:spore coat protein U-like protein
LKWAPSALIACAAAVGLVAAPAAAASCNLSPQGVAFGGYDTLSASPHDGVGNIAVTCDAAASFTISISAGSGTYPQRLMAGGAGALPYNLYTDATRTLVWGDGSGSTGTVSVTTSSSDIPVYGRIRAGENVAAGSYADSLVVTVSY